MKGNQQHSPLRTASRWLGLPVGIGLWVIPFPLPAVDVTVPPELGIVDFQLSNGLSIVVAVRPGLRLAAVNLTVGVGSVDDLPGYLGMAHLLEHVTLAGSETVGSFDRERELEALAKLDRAFQSYRVERRKPAASPRRVAELERRFDEAHAAAIALAEKGEILGGRLEARGAIGLNATTTADATQYFARIPVAEVNLWLELEADRLRWPILRRFYSEREVVLREIETLTGGRRSAQERFLNELFPELPAANPVAGVPAEIHDFDRPTAFEFFHRLYRPENIAISVVGDVDPAEIRQLCEKHFGDWRPPPAEHAGVGDPAGRQIPLSKPHVRGYNSIRSPLVFLAFPGAEPGSVDGAIQLALAEYINSEELSPFQRRFLRERPLAWSTGAAAHYPSEKVDGIFLIHLYGNSGVPHQTLVKEATRLLAEIAEADDQELQGAIIQAQMRQIGELEDPSRLASLLALHQAIHDDWRMPFARLLHLSRLRPEKIRSYARSHFSLDEARIRLVHLRPSQKAQVARPPGGIEGGKAHASPR